LKPLFFSLVIGIATVAQAREPAQMPVLEATAPEAEAAALSAQFLERYAYRPVPLDDALSVKVMNKYIKSLDPDRMLFTQSDIDGFAKDSKKIDDAIQNKNLDIPFSMFKIYNQRVVERMTYARSLLKNGFDFTVQEDYPLLREDAPWAKTEEQANELWRKRVKSDWLRLKLADQDEAKIRDTLQEHSGPCRNL